MSAVVEMDASSVLRAGGIAPLGAKIEGDVRAGAVSARGFAHPALPGETIVRLVPEVLAPGVEIEMETLGFARAPDADRPSLGQQRFRALGFPGWPLVHDPARAKFALEVMKSFKKAAARARSKPGHARDEFVEIGARLARSVPHFLPSFWEEAGRTFLAEDSATFAAQCFEKARQAEKEHNLSIDEDVRSAVYLEFALAGAVAAKSLAGYAKELAEAYGPAKAWPRYRELAVRRVLGGMPPWVGMGKELRALARAAKLDLAAEDASFLSEILEAPAIARAPGELWTSYRDALIALAKERAAVRKRLRHLFPVPTSGANGFPVAWLALLGEAGALEGLSADSGDDSEETGGAAEWLNKALSFVDGDPAILPIVRAIAPRLVRDGTPVQLAFGSNWRSRVDLDVTELALGLEVPIAAPLQRASIDLARPFACDPVRLGADARFSSMLLDAVEVVLGTAPFEEAARGKEGLRAARGAWVRREVARLSKVGLPAVAAATQRLRQKATAALWNDFPDALESLKTTDVAEALACSLRIGVFAELTWPAWESLVKTIGAQFTVSGAWPYPVLLTTAKAWVLGPEGVVFEHDLVLPPKVNPQRVTWIDGDLLVSFWSSEGARAYWASSANEPFSTEGYMSWWGHELPTSFALPDSGVTIGGAAIHRGDRKFGSFEAFVTDGELFWTGGWEDGRYRLREFDPKTGQKGRVSWPRFMDAAAALDDGRRVLRVDLMPAPPAAAESPLGCKDGLLGLFTRGPDQQSSASAQAVGIDDRRWEGKPGDGVPTALLRLPGDDRPRAVSVASGWSADGKRTRIFDADGIEGCVVHPRDFGGAGWTEIPPLSLWHFARARDEAGSKALRAVDTRIARVLLDAASTDRARDETRKTLPSTRAAIASALPEITAVPLLDAVAAAALEASDRVARINDVLSAATSTNPAVDDKIADTSINDALGILASSRWSQAFLSDEVSAVSRTMRGEVVATFQASSHDWTQWIGALRGLAVLASLSGREVADRAVMARVLALFAGSVFAEEGRTFRRFAVRVAGDAPIRSATSNVWCARVDQGCFLFRTSHHDGAWYGNALELSLDGTFRVPAGVTISDEERFTTADEAPWLRAWIAASASAPAPTSIDGAAVESFASIVGLTRPEATLVLAGLPRIDRYESDFLGKELRERLGLKTTDAKVAREQLKELDRKKLLRVFAAAAPDDPRALFQPYGETDFVERLGRAWNEVFGARRALREELVLACEKDLDPPLPAAAILGALLEPASAAMLRVGPVALEALFATNNATDMFRATTASSIALLLPWLFHALPVGDPYRDALPALHSATLATLANADLVLPLKYLYCDESQKGTVRKLVESIGGDETPLTFGNQVSELARDGGGLIGAILGNGHQARLAFRPGRMGESTLAFQLGRDQSLTAYGSFGAIEAVAFLRSRGLAAMMARVKETPVPVGSYEANPAASHPGLVSSVEKALKISRDAATHYLQLLALAEPTSKAVQTWNGWKPPLYKKTCAELVEKKLVVEGKRERAQREVFLPGAWDKSQRGKNLPFETWKLPLYVGEHGALARNVALRPHHELFEAAWNRVQSGDVPKFEEV